MDHSLISHPLELVLENLTTKKTLSFDEFCELLFTFHFEDFDELFGISDLQIPTETYLRIPVIQADFTAFLKVWGIQNYSSIRDHQNYDSKIKVIKGSLTEVNYRENSNFIEYDSKTIIRTGEIFVEEQQDINSIINNSEDISVSLHIYRSPEIQLGGIRIFDTEKRKIGLLSREAKSCNWAIPQNSFQKITQL